MINQDKKATTYQATLPDGTVLKKKSFNISTDEAYMGAFKHNGQWMASGITEQVQNWGEQQFFKATKIK